MRMAGDTPDALGTVQRQSQRHPILILEFPVFRAVDSSGPTHSIPGDTYTCQARLRSCRSCELAGRAPGTTLRCGHRDVQAGNLWDSASQRAPPSLTRSLQFSSRSLDRAYPGAYSTGYMCRTLVVDCSHCEGAAVYRRQFRCRDAAPSDLPMGTLLGIGVRRDSWYMEVLQTSDIVGTDLLRARRAAYPICGSVSLRRCM
jgi:hypothetical protein